jgi:hypothetical protein
MRRESLSCLALLSALLSGTALAEIPVHYVLAGQVVMADLSPSQYLPQDAYLALEFQSKFKAAFPGQVINLDDPDQWISPSERVIIIIPKITIARTTDDLRAGSVHDFESLVVGDVSAIDPWTNATLYSGTRMISTQSEIGDSEISHADTSLRVAFRNSADKWMDATIDQMRRNFAPFVLDAATLAIPQKAKQFKGGIWPFGAGRGVRVGQTLSAGGGHFAKVSAAFQNYSVISDVANPARVIPAGEEYSMTLVDKPTDRPEPRIEISWLGNAPSAPEGNTVHVISTSALVSLFGNYLSKDGGFKILPPGLDNVAAENQLRLLSQKVSSRSKEAVLNYGDFARDNFVQRANHNPDRKVEIGVLERYHGAKTKPDGSKLNYYRVTLAASIEERAGTDESPVYAVASVVTQAEELQNVEAAGIREIDPSSVYLTLYRNAIIHLAEKARASMAGPYQVDVQKDSVVSGSGIDWSGNQPGAFTPLSWLRPYGEVVSSDNKPLGTLYRVMLPTQGYLNVSSVSREKLEAGDILRYKSSSQKSRPLVGITLAEREVPPEWVPEKRWLEILAGSDLANAGNAQIIPLVDGDPTPFGIEKTATVKIGALGVSSEGKTTTFTGQWRCQVRAQGSEPTAPPLLQFGLQSDLPVTLKSNDPSLIPLDTGGWGLDYTLNALKAFAEMGSKKNINQAFSVSN